MNNSENSFDMEILVKTKSKKILDGLSTIFFIVSIINILILVGIFLYYSIYRVLTMKEIIRKPLFISIVILTAITVLLTFVLFISYFFVETSKYEKIKSYDRLLNDDVVLNLGLIVLAAVDKNIRLGDLKNIRKILQTSFPEGMENEGMENEEIYYKIMDKNNESIRKGSDSIDYKNFFLKKVFHKYMSTINAKKYIKYISYLSNRYSSIYKSSCMSVGTLQSRISAYRGSVINFEELLNYDILNTLEIKIVKTLELNFNKIINTLENKDPMRFTCKNGY